MIKTTKLGIPDSLLVALIFAAGLVDSVVFVGLALFVLLFEKEQYVKDAAKRALMLFGIFAILQGALHALDYLIRIILSNESGYNNIYNNLAYMLAASKCICYLVFAIMEAWKYMSLRGAGVAVTKEAPAAPAQPTPAAAQPAPATAQPAPAVAQPAPAAAPAAVCPQCGNPVDKGVHFCKKCGAKTTV